jgi:hypothetical protein
VNAVSQSRFRRVVARRWAAVWICISCGCLHAPDLERIAAVNIQRHVDFLASDALAGRWYRSDEAKIAADYIARHFAAAGLEPLSERGDFFLPVDDAQAAPNVAAVWPGTTRDCVIIGAHYDHLKPAESGDDRIYNGADDNASGVAAVLEIAAALGRDRPRLAASILLIAFTGEEEGLVGSYHFVRTNPQLREFARGCYNMDMISRGVDHLVLLEGGPKAPRLLADVEAANRRVGLTLRKDTHPEFLLQSDQLPFLQAGIPALYFGVAEHEDYHQVTDHADKILPLLAARIARLVYLAALGTAEPIARSLHR